METTLLALRLVYLLKEWRPSPEIQSWAFSFPQMLRNQFLVQVSNPIKITLSPGLALVVAA